jgi:hypothetical protein|tara:strand:+ start:2809 stop:3657 length:849 start_codon:yes stop_codon:yes gene_type:complete
MSESLFNYNSLPFDIVGTDLSFGGGRNKVVNKATKNEIKRPSSLKVDDVTKFYGNQLPQVFGADFKPQLKVPEGMKALPSGELVKEGFIPTGIARGVTGLIDTILRDTTDLDKRGIGGEDLGKLDLNDPSNYEFTPIQKMKIEEDLAGRFPEPDKSPVESADEFLEKMKIISPEMRKQQRADSRAAAIDSTLNYALTEPLRQTFNKRAGDIAQQRLLDARGVIEQMPSSVQNIMTAKQNQLLSSSAGFGEEARAIATQQDAATRFAGLGMQRAFGQPTFKVG